VRESDRAFQPLAHRVTAISRSDERNRRRERLVVRAVLPHNRSETFSRPRMTLERGARAARELLSVAPDTMDARWSVTRDNWRIYFVRRVEHTYDLIFTQSSMQLPVEVTITPKANPTAGLMRGFIDLPTPSQSVGKCVYRCRLGTR